MMIYYQLLLPQGRYFLTESPECHCIEQSCSVCRVSKTPKLSSKDTCLGVSCLLSCVLLAAAVSSHFSVYLEPSMSEGDQTQQTQRDLSSSPSDYGHDHYEPTPTSFCPDGVPLEFALLSLLAAFGAAFGILYVALTQAGGGRRKRSGETGEGSFLVFNTELADLLWTGRQ